MLGVDPRTARSAWTVFLVALVIAILYLIRMVVLIFVVAILFAYLLSPLVNMASRLLPWGRSRTLALAAVYVILLAVLVGAGALIVPRVGEEAAALGDAFPKLVKDWQAKLEQPEPGWFPQVQKWIFEKLRERGEELGASAVPFIRDATAHVLSLLGRLLIVVMVPILGFFFLKDGRELSARVLGLFSDHQRGVWQDITGDINVLLGQFIRALTILAAATLVCYGIFFVVIGLPYAALLSTVAGVLEFIPLFGPLTAAALIVSVALFSGFGHLLLILLFLGGYRIFQDYILSPQLMSKGIELHPLLVIFGALAGEELAGIPGMFLSVPVIATLRVIYVRIRKARAAVAEVV